MGKVGRSFSNATVTLWTIVAVDCGTAKTVATTLTRTDEENLIYINLH